MAVLKRSEEHNEESIMLYIRNALVDIGCVITEKKNKNCKIKITPLQSLELSIKLENHFSIHFRDELISDQPTVQEIYKLVKKSLYKDLENFMD